MPTRDDVNASTRTTIHDDDHPRHMLDQSRVTTPPRPSDAAVTSFVIDAFR
jgi:hypothetical protein